MKIKIAYSLFFLQFIAICLSAQKIYVVDEGLLLGLSESKDLKISAALGSNAVIGESLSFQAGYSPMKYLALQASNFSFNHTSVRDVSVKSNVFSGAIGSYYFLPLQKKRPNSRNLQDNLQVNTGILIDLYIGYSKGHVTNIFPKSDGAVKNHFSKTFLQGGIHWQINKFGIDYVYKIGNLDYQTLVSNGFYANPVLLATGFEAIEEYDLYQFREHSIRLRVQILQAGIFLSYTRANFPERVNSFFVNNAYHVGLIIDMDEFFKKDK